VNVAVRREHSLLEEIKERSVCDTEHFRGGRFGCGGSRINAEPLNVGMAQHEVTSRFMSDKGIGGTISAKHAMRIRVEVCHAKDRQVFNIGESRPIACADSFCHWGSFRPWLRLPLSRHLVLPLDCQTHEFHCNGNGRGRNTAPIPIAAEMTRWVRKADIRQTIDVG